MGSMAASPIVPTAGEGLLSVMNIVITVLVVLLVAALARRIRIRRELHPKSTSGNGKNTGSPEK